MVTAASTRAKLRADLVVSEQRQAEGLFFVLKDPATGRFLRFREPEYFIARQLDGESPLDEIQKRTQQKFGSEISLDALGQFTETLRRLGLLEDKATGRASPTTKRHVRGNLLYLRFPAFDPDRFLERLAPSLGAFFTPAFLVSSALAVLLAFGVTLLNRAEIQRDLAGLWRFDALLLAWLVILSVTGIHELAHAFTCKRFGGEVREMGFMLIYFQPAFYCNVSDAWLFPEKSRRLWVTFSGAYVEMFIWALATLVWRVVEPDTWISFVAMIVMATSAIKSLFNLNPLIKLDGYYLLSDYLEIPNLRQKSLGYLGGCFSRLLGAAVHTPEAPSGRERRIYVTYGLLAGAYSFWLMGYVALQFGSFLISRYQGVGLILFGGFLMLLLRNPVTRWLARVRAALKAARARTGSKLPLKLLGGAVALAGLLFLGRWELTVGGKFTALPLHNADIETEVEGIVEKISVDEGDWVEKGAAIAHLSNRELLADLEAIDAKVGEKHANLKMLAAGPRAEQIAVARKELDTARSRMEESRRRYQDALKLHGAEVSRAGSVVKKVEARREYAEKDLERLRTLLDEGLVSRQRFEASEEQVAIRWRELEEAEAELRELQLDELSEFKKEVTIATKEVAETEAKLQLRLLTVVSPISGFVTTPSLKLHEKVGQLVKKGDLVAEVHELKTILAELAVSEKDIGEVRLGQKVVVRVRAYPEKSFEGQVVSIATTASHVDGAREASIPSEREKTFLVTTRLDNGSLLLKPGMTGHAKIYCGGRRMIDLVSRSIAGYLRVEFWSWW